MWEWFTTKPFVDAKECRFVSAILPVIGHNTDISVRVDWFGADPLAVLADCSSTDDPT